MVTKKVKRKFEEYETQILELSNTLRFKNCRLIVKNYNGRLGVYIMTENSVMFYVAVSQPQTERTGQFFKDGYICEDLKDLNNDLKTKVELLD